VSLILDALRKADAERERGSVPSLHSQPVVSPSLEVSSQPAVRPHWVWIALGVGLGLVAAVTWVMTARNAPAPSAVTTNAASAQPGLPEPAAARPAPAIAPATTNASDARPIAEPAPWRQPSETKAPRADAKNEAKNDAKNEAPVRVLGNVPLATAPVYSRDQLPPDIRAALPQFAIGGSVYSPNPTARSLIINGQLYREKDRLTQDLSLEEIKLKSAIFNMRGYRFEVMF